MAFFRVLWAETLKTRRTVALRMAVLTPAALAILMSFVAFEAPFSFLLSLRIDLWLALTRRLLFIWTALALPLAITLEAALMAGLEHSENQWKNLFALPVPRWTVYVSKLLVVAALVTFSTAVLIGLVIPAGKVLSLVEKQLPFATPSPWLALFRLGGEVTGLTVLAVAIQQWVSVRWRSFPVAVGLGLVVTIAGFVILAATARDGPWWTRYFPWTLPSVTVIERPANLTPFLLFSAGLGFLAAAAGCWEFCRRDVK
jgi:hypothetical protein